MIILYKYPVVSDWIHLSLLSGTKLKQLTKFNSIDPK